MIVTFEYTPLLEDFAADGTLQLGAIMKILENSGNKHSDMAGDNILKGSSSGIAWIMTDWMLDISSYPKYGDKLSASTWSETVKQPLACMRDFELYSNGKSVVRGLTKWVLVDLKSGRPLRVSPELIEKYQPEDKALFEDSKMPKIAMPAAEDFTKETKITLRRGDIDFNNHVHNLTYLDFALEALPAAIYEEKKTSFSKVRIAYKTGIKAGEAITCRYAEMDGKHIVYIFGDDDKVRTQIELA
ncbi:MAG: hypothetical protein K5681_06680 [Treponema sp.]|nr:hypothetical protein [Treponema sp.]